MSRKWLVVCFLALVGCVSVFVVGHSKAHGSTPQPYPTGVLHQERRQNRPARSVSPREARIPVHRVNSAGLAVNQTNLASPGAANISIPLTFEPNVGQADAAVEYVGRGKGLTVFLTRGEIAVRVARPARIPSEDAGRR